jgi:phosphohistidine phosphatase
MSDQKQLIIVRHGKSSWKYENIEDFDRHLKEKGIHDVFTMAKRLDKQHLKPDLMITSPAIRAFHTANIMARTLDYPLDRIQIQKAFYPGRADDIIQIINKADDNLDSIMIFGHNPAFTNVANYFLQEDIEKLPTSGIAKVRLETNSWKNIDKCHTENILLDYPKKKG